MPRFQVVGKAVRGASGSGADGPLYQPLRQISPDELRRLAPTFAARDVASFTLLNRARHGRVRVGDVAKAGFFC